MKTDSKKHATDQVDSTETRILEAAEREFMLKGYAATRTTAIAEAAGVTHAMLHYYFRTKDNLFSRVMSDKLSAVATSFRIPIDKDKSIADCIRSAVESHFAFMRANPLLPRFMVTEVFTNDALIDLLKERIAAIAGETIFRLQQKIDRDAADGKCRNLRAQSLLLDILSLNVFPILALPMAQKMSAALGYETIDTFLDIRCEENVQTILSKLLNS